MTMSLISWKNGIFQVKYLFFMLTDAYAQSNEWANWNISIALLSTNFQVFYVGRFRDKSWVFKSRFFFKVRQYGQQQLYLQYKMCWILYKMVCALSFPQPYLCIQPPLQSPPKIRYPTSVNFNFLILPLLVHKIILIIPTNTHFC